MPWTISLCILNMGINASTAHRLLRFAIIWDDYSIVTGMLIIAAPEVIMRKLLIAAAERAIRYLEGLNGRGVTPDPTVVARLAELDIPLPDYPSTADETLALLDSYGAATMAMAGPRFFGFVIGGALPATLAANWLASAWDQNSALAGVTPLTAKLEEVALRWLRDV